MNNFHTTAGTASAGAKGWRRTSGIAWALLCGALSVQGQTNWALVGWNNLGMHCMDSDYSVFSILPPYNTIHAQLIDGQGKLVTNATGIGVTYHAISDLDGSINTYSDKKGNFWDHVEALFGIALPPETGLPVPGPESFQMPGASNVARAMKFETGLNWFAAYGIPIAPYDDRGKPNQYPMMRLMATNNTGQVLAMTDIVLPVSDEMDCSLCHASGSEPAARPLAGWVHDSNPGRDFRLNILRLHDEAQATNPAFHAALAAQNMYSNGLFATVTLNYRPILCASCHQSEALPGSGIAGIPPLTQAMHGHHAQVIDPRNGHTLDAAENRMACYSCHPGSVTRCLRGTMGKAVAADGSMSMQCQNCHGSMSDVGHPARTGWLEEPNCQACHVGSATNALGTIRFLNALTNGSLRIPPETLFATTPHTPMTNTSLYRFSKGHGGLQCAACHGSTHAEFPSALPADNMANIERQGHAGVLGECAACHPTVPNTQNGGPHGMHPVGQAWISRHNNAAQLLGLNACRTCHGRTGEGSVLARAFSEKTVTSERGTVHYWRGRNVTCYSCHNGMTTGDPTQHGFPTITNVIGVTTSGVPLALALSGPNTRIVEQPRHGAVALTGNQATYFPDHAFTGKDVFTFAVNNGYNDSELGYATVTVHAGTAEALVVDSPELFELSAVQTNLRVRFASKLSQPYRTEATTQLTDSAWSTNGVMVWGHSDSTGFTNALAGEGQGFIRVVAIPPQPPPMRATDSATNTIYDAGWLAGANGGAGFGAWTLVASNAATAGFFIATPANTNMSMTARAWGLWANSGATATATRAMSAPLQVGEGLTLRFDNNQIQTGGQVGFALLNAAGQTLVAFTFTGGQSVYRVDDRAGSRATWIPWSDKGWDITVRIAAQGEYHLTCGDYIVPGLFKNVADQAVAALKVWNANAGSGSARDVYFDQLGIIQP